LVFIAFLLNIQHLRDSVENKFTHCVLRQGT